MVRVLGVLLFVLLGHGFSVGRYSEAGAHSGGWGEHSKGVPTRACLDLFSFLLWIGLVTEVTDHCSV